MYMFSALFSFLKAIFSFSFPRDAKTFPLNGTCPPLRKAIVFPNPAWFLFRLCPFSFFATRSAKCSLHSQDCQVRSFSSAGTHNLRRRADSFFFLPSIGVPFPFFFFFKRSIRTFRSRRLRKPSSFFQNQAGVSFKRSFSLCFFGRQSLRNLCNKCVGTPNHNQPTFFPLAPNTSPSFIFGGAGSFLRELTQHCFPPYLFSSKRMPIYLWSRRLSPTSSFFFSLLY